MAVEFSKNIGEPGRLEWLPKESLILDRNYQRDSLPRHVQKICREFSWRFFQPPTVAPNGKGQHFVVDGQHRVLAAKLHPQVTDLPCYVINDTETTQQAETFKRTNTDRVAVNAVYLYWAGIAAGSVDDLELRDALAEAEVEIVKTLGELAVGKTNSVSTLRKCLKSHGREPLITSLKAIKAAYPSNPRALAGDLVHAVCRIAAINMERLERDHLVKTLASLDLDQLSQDAVSYSKVDGCGRTTAIARIITRQYNRAFKGNKPRRLEDVG